MFLLSPKYNKGVIFWSPQFIVFVSRDGSQDDHFKSYSGGQANVTLASNLGVQTLPHILHIRVPPE